VGKIFDQRKSNKFWSLFFLHILMRYFEQKCSQQPFILISKVLENEYRDLLILLGTNEEKKFKKPFYFRHFM